jgi:hypothetical protein
MTQESLTGSQMTCESCIAHSKNPICGLYHMGCRDCQVRIVMSTYPNRIGARTMLWIIEKHAGTQARDEVAAIVKKKVKERK